MLLDQTLTGAAARPRAATGDEARLLWLDAARGVGIILVVFGHTIDGLAEAVAEAPPGADLIDPVPSYYRIAYDAIYSFHMPLFFFLSGLVFLPSIQQRPLAQSFSRRLVTILWPYVLWSYLFIGIKFAVPSMVNNPVTLSELVSAPWPPKEHLWFLSSLFAVQALALPLKHARGYAIPIAAAVGVVFLLATSARLLTPTDEFIRETARVLPFFLIGIVFAGCKIPAPKRWSAALAYALAFAVAESLYLFVFPQVRLYILPFVALTGTICTTQCVRWLIARLNGGWASLSLATLGRLSMAIYLAHVLFSAAARELFARAGLESPDMQFLVGSAAGVLGPVAMYYALKRFGLTRLAGVGG